MSSLRAEQPITPNKRPGKRRVAIAGSLLAAAGVAGIAVAPHIGGGVGGEKNETVGKVPGIETCTADTASAIGKTCITALQIAGDVVAKKAPHDMHVTETSSAFTTTFGKPSYTITQKSAGNTNPTATQEYRISFGVNKDGKADLGNIVEEAGVNDNNLAFIDRNGGNTYTAGFQDVLETPEPKTYPTADAAGVQHMVEATDAALAAFTPPKQ